MRRLRIALAQINTTVGDFTGNRRKITDAISQAKAAQADIVVLPELAVCGYPPEDLLFKPQFIKANLETLRQIAPATDNICAMVGFVDADSDIYNAAGIFYDGELAGVYHKIYLPNYGVFDENRYFRPGNVCPVYTLYGIKIGVTICEDIWYETGPANIQAYNGAKIILNISASPYHTGKGAQREQMIVHRAVDTTAIFAYANAVGGQDELVFDGHSLIINEQGEIVARGKQFEEDLVIADVDADSVSRSRRHVPSGRKDTVAPEQKNWIKTTKVISSYPRRSEKHPFTSKNPELLSLPGEVYRALTLGTRDYVNKNGFTKVVIGLSGGIDSALVATIAVDALGSQNVIGVNMPSQFSSPGSITDTAQLAANLKIVLLSVPITSVYQSYMESLAPSFDSVKADITEENLQARIRGNLLMALSNKFGWLVLTTGNKSEMATGYTTLYGDMAGGFAVIKDVPKTMVYQISRYRNEEAGYNLIPESIFTKPPSAELRPGQKDVDSLPPYDILDPILTAYVEQNQSVEQIVAMRFEEAVTRKVARLVDLSEYKRRQAPPGVKITTRAFGRDRRLPITNHFQEW